MESKNTSLEREEIPETHVIKGQVYRIYKEILQISKKTRDNSVGKKWANKFE